ncbi:hypothetical protein SAMN05518855_100958 [Paenibacillus sp. CF384]|nr:hypothetical protein SAMN05518855_100958 [Paenibacillus sp. CF384]
MIGEKDDLSTWRGHLFFFAFTIGIHRLIMRLIIITRGMQT